MNTTYVTFNQAKKLKEKKFTESCMCFYFEDGQFSENVFRDSVGQDYGSPFTVEFSELIENWNNGFVTKKSGDRCFGCNKSKGYFETFSAPEQWVVVEWLRLNHNVWISVEPAGRFWKFAVFDEKVTEVENISLALNESPQKAYSSAFDYVLEKII